MTIRELLELTKTGLLNKLFEMKKEEMIYGVPREVRISKEEK